MNKTSSRKLGLILILLLIFSLLAISGPVAAEEKAVGDESTLETVGEQVYKEEPEFHTMSATPEEYFDYNKNEITGEAEITGYSPDGPKDVVIPSTLGGYPVTSINDGEPRDGAFSNLGLTSVLIPDGLTRVGTGPFPATT